MKPKLTIVFLTLIILPLVALAWVGIIVAKDEQQFVQKRFEQMLGSRLEQVDKQVGMVLGRYEQQVDKLLHLDSSDFENLRSIERNERMVQQLFVLDSDGKRLYPEGKQQRNQQEEAFIVRTQRIWETKELFYRPVETARSPNQSSGQSSKQVSNRTAEGSSKGFKPTGNPSSRQSPSPAAGVNESGWYVWYWGSGINLIYWRRDPDGKILGAEIDRMALMADIVGELPQTKLFRSDEAADSQPANGRIQLVDANGNSIYRWGDYHPEDTGKPLLTRSLSKPLNSWRVQYFVNPAYTTSGYGGTLVVSMVVGFGVLILCIVGLAVFFIRESGRDMRDARQKVTFVNQVSHELKTPLTNIRMYAELLEDQIDEEDEQQRKYVTVLVQESQRLSRLIGNGLSFARQQRGKFRIRASLGVVDNTIVKVVEQFKPGLEKKTLAVAFKAGAPETVDFDADVVEQVLGNLLSNVEKYAVSGSQVIIQSSVNIPFVEITVQDNGPGISQREKKRIFRPFYRVSGKLTDGVSGTGIGLSIARELARQHGGDLTILPSKKGAHFKFVLKIQGLGV